MNKILKFSSFWLNKAIIAVVILILAFNMPVKDIGAAWGYEDVVALINNKPENQQNSLNESLLPKMMKVVLTGYSSTPDQTDDTPFITASNTRVRDGVVAANFLAFGTKVQIPSLFGNKVFTVEDRMARKHNDKIDIWFPERHLAKNFGVQEADVIILE